MEGEGDVEVAIEVEWALIIMKLNLQWKFQQNLSSKKLLLQVENLFDGSEVTSMTSTMKVARK